MNDIKYLDTDANLSNITQTGMIIRAMQKQWSVGIKEHRSHDSLRLVSTVLEQLCSAEIVPRVLQDGVNVR